MCNNSFINITVPGVSAYAASSGLQQNSTSPPTWTKGLTEDDINAMYRKHICNRPISQYN